VEEKRQGFLNVVSLSLQCSAWLASTMEDVLGFPGESEFVKSFREGAKILIVRRGGNKAGQFLEASVFGLGGRRGFLLILEGRGGCGWRKFFGEIRKASDFLSNSVGGGSFSSVSAKKKGVKEEDPKVDLCSSLKRPSFAEVLKRGSGLVTPVMSIVGERPSRSRWPLVEMCPLAILPTVRYAEYEAFRSAVDCFAMEKPSFEPLDKKPLEPPSIVPLVKKKVLCPLGKMKKQPSAHGALRSKFHLNLRTWSKYFKLALGRVVGKF
jgi:hypothetical protein